MSDCTRDITAPYTTAITDRIMTGTMARTAISGKKPMQKRIMP